MMKKMKQVAMVSVGSGYEQEGAVESSPCRQVRSHDLCKHKSANINLTIENVIWNCWQGCLPEMKSTQLSLTCQMDILHESFAFCLSDDQHWPQIS